MQNKILHIFDMDDTLLDTPVLVDFIETDSEGYVINPDPALKSHMKSLSSSAFILFSKEFKFKKSGDFIVVVNAKNGRPMGPEFIQAIEELRLEDMEPIGLPDRTPKEMQRSVALKDGVVVLEPFGGFHASKETVGSRINDKVASVYRSVDNKMILTGREDDAIVFDKWKQKKEKVKNKLNDKWHDAVARAETPEKKAEKLSKPNQADDIQKQIDSRAAGLINMKAHIKDRLQELGLEYPNYGLMLYTGEGGIPKFKSHTIERTIRENGFDEVHYYEDRKDWLDAAENHLSKVMPEIKFVGHFITNMKDEKTL